MSKRYTFSKPDLCGILKVVFYAGGAGAVIALLNLLPDVQFPLMFAWMTPIVNVALVAAKKFFQNKVEAQETKED